jgi:hypothetical protein
MQLSAKALLRPFSSTPTTGPVDATETNTSDPIHNDVDDDNVPSLEEVEDDEEEEDEGCEDKDVGEEDEDDNDNDDNDEDPFDGLTSEESQELMNDTASVMMALDKVC